MSDPLGFFITWTTYGTWLPGDARGWVRSGEPDIQAADPQKEIGARGKLLAEPVLLTTEQRSIVEQTIHDHCNHRKWKLHAVNARTNHVHVVVTADVTPEQVMGQFKAWCSRRLNAKWHRKQWWTEHGSTRWLNDAESFGMAVDYVVDYQ
jgi:REP element-mobilizing transposase RayT